MTLETKKEPEGSAMFFIAVVCLFMFSTFTSSRTEKAKDIMTSQWRQQTLVPVLLWAAARAFEWMSWTRMTTCLGSVFSVTTERYQRRLGLGLLLSRLLLRMKIRWCVLMRWYALGLTTAYTSINFQCHLSLCKKCLKNKMNSLQYQDKQYH